MIVGDPNPAHVQYVPPHKRASPPTPLVLIHDGGGTVFSYYILGSLGRDVWAIYDPKFFDGEAWGGGMDEMARHYIGLLVEAGITGTIMLGGWSLGCLLSLTMAHMLARDPSANIAIAGFLFIDSPYHNASFKLTAKTSEPRIEGINNLVQKSLDNCDVMLKHWELPTWEGPSGGGKEREVRVAGQSFPLQPGSVLYKPFDEGWKCIKTRQYQHGKTVDEPMTPPPGVLIRCTRPAETVQGSGPEPTSIDLHRNETLLGWEGSYPDFLLAVMDVDTDHYKVFGQFEQDKIRNITSLVNTGIEILEGLGGPGNDSSSTKRDRFTHLAQTTGGRRNGHIKGIEELECVRSVILDSFNFTCGRGSPEEVLSLRPPYMDPAEDSLLKWATFTLNSFGFGGANAHAILENFVSDPKHVEEPTGPLMAPFNFSAGTEKSLANLLATYSSFIKEQPAINLRDLSWTLNTRRSTLPARVSISAPTALDLAKKLQEISQSSAGFKTVSGSQAASEGKPRLLGVFTGQGAQWATMGADLLRSSPLVSECIDMLQDALNTLPAEHVPEWTIREELLKDKDSSRIGQAALSQPLCTAVQIALVTLLKAAKVDLAAIVGHSSGEIAAAHAAGYLAAEDAIRIAYYRGFFLKLAGSADGAQGGMMAIGTSHEDAQELCELPSLEGRIRIAAKNSPNSLTLSGDLDAIEEAKEILEDEKKFARLLKVDKAYHSHHMKPCFEPYVAALKACNIRVQARSDDGNLPVWISSVVGENVESTDLSELQGRYWGDNMCQAVLFSQAVEYAIGAEGPFDMGIEIGPHPALKGPAISTIKEISGQELPYTGTLARGVNGIEAISDSFASLWQSLGPAVVNFTAFDEAVHGSKVPPKLLKGLPTYSWDHDRVYWHESRYSKAFRGRSQVPHELLGTICPDGIDNEVRFKNHLTTREIPWLVHHQIQGQIVFPAAGYISAVVEAAVKLYPVESIQLLDFVDFVIGQALTLEENGGIDTILSLKVVEESPGVDELVFAYYSDSGKDSGTMVKNASGKLRVIRGAASKDTLPAPHIREGLYQDLEWERFYMATGELGFGYTGPFRALSNTSRRLGEALGTLGVPEAEGKSASSLIIHPGTLDCAIQSIMLAFSYPGDGRLRTIYLPTKVDRLRINLAHCREMATGLRLDGEEERDWASNPMFQHLVRKASHLVTGQSMNKPGAAIKPQLLEATGEEEVFDILSAGFLIKLQVALQADPDKPMLEMSPDELGVDSLVAVDIQSWFRKELSVDMPVLKVLNALSVRNLLYAAQEMLAPEMVPNLDGEAKPKSAEPPKEVSPAPAPAAKPRDLAPTLTDIPSKQTTVDYASSSERQSTSVSELESQQPMTTPTTPLAISASMEEEKQLGSHVDDKDRFERVVPMSFAQSRFWFLNLFVENKTAFNVTSLVHLKGKLGIERFGRALTDVGQRHEAIRTVFYTDENTKQHMQGVLPKSTLTLQHANVKGEADIQEAVREMQDHVFDLAKGDSLRLQLLSLSEDRHCIILTYHHIAVDGIGFPIFFADLEKAYNGTLNLSGAGMLQYPDFSLRQLREYEQGSWSKQLSHWRSQFPDLPAPLPLLPLSQRSWRPNSSSFGSHLVEFRMDQALKGQIEQCCRRFKVTPFHFYLAVFRILLFRYTNGIEDMCVGVADGNRKDADVLQSLGLFLNLLPLRFRQDSRQTFADTLKDVKKTSDGAFANSRVPFDLILSEVQVPRSPSYSPLFQSFLNYRQNIVEARSFCGCESDGELITGGQNAYDISVDVVDVSSGDNLVVFAVNKDLYSKDDAEVLKKSYLALLQGFARNPATRIVWPALHLEEDVKGALEFGPGDEQSTQWPLTIVDRIDDMSKVYSERAALTNGFGTSITYKLMASRVSQLAALLLDRGVGSSSCVGVFQSPGPEWVCSMLAILRTGAAYVPLDSSVGLDRLLLVIKDCRPRVLFVDSMTNGEIKFLLDSGADMVDVSTAPWSQEAKFVPSQAKPSDTAAIAYTSGTTGAPKGVVLKHSGYKNFLEFAVPRWKIKEGNETILQQSSYAFDMSMGQIIVCLGYGGTLVIPGGSLRRDPAAICDMLVSQGVTFTLGTPTEYMAWIRHGGQELLQTSQWRGAMSGGESMTESLVRAFRSLEKPDLRLINSYGPAETTCGCADSEVSLEDGEDLSFAVTPSPNYSIYIVDEKMVPVPAGVPGQVLIGGAGVAGGYLNQDKATSAAFLPDKQATPFFKQQGWTTVHASGDRGRFTPDGRLVLQGRVEGSTQIKIGGIRMDLEDIERTIVNAAAPHIRQAVVSARQMHDSDYKYLVAFVELSDNETDQDAFLAELPQKLPLPQYMRPSTVVALDAIPKTSSNKVDRSAIKSMELHESTQFSAEDSISDLDEFEKSLLGLWQQVLPQEVLGSRNLNKGSDFFHVGGNSLSLVSLQTQIRERLNISIPLSQLFQAITLGEMAAMLQDQNSEMQASSVDWEREVEIPSDLANAPKAANAVQPSAIPSVVALTGSTGFLGKEILRQLINSDKIKKIYCLAVRKPREQLSKILDHPKVVIYRGDLGAKQFGLSQQDAKTVFDEVDAVIHVGADVSFMKTYQSLKLINVASTKELVRLGVPRRVPFHFVSSASVARLSGLDAFGQVSVEDFPPNGEKDDGYTSSKWVSEVYLERINKQLGLPVAIHRPSSITGDDAPESDLMSNMMKYSREIKAIPDSSAWSGHFDFISVQSVARTIIADVMAGAEKPSDSTRYLYESGEIEIAMDEVRDLMEMGTGESFAVLSVDEWIDLAARAGMNPLLAMYLRRAAGGQVLFPRLLQE